MKLRIVVADDNTAFLAKIVSVLTTEFEVVATAADGRSALECIRLYRPNVAVLDLEMPGLNGLEVTRELAESSGVMEAPLRFSLETNRRKILVFPALGIASPRHSAEGG